jgi:hypothetical protein
MGPGTKGYQPRKKTEGGIFGNIGLSQEKRDARRKAREARRNEGKDAKPADRPDASRVAYKQSKPEPASSGGVRRTVLGAPAAGAPFPRPSAKSPSTPLADRAKVAVAKGPKSTVTAVKTPPATMATSGPLPRPKAASAAKSGGLVARLGKALASNTSNQDKAKARMLKESRKN